MSEIYICPLCGLHNESITCDCERQSTPKAMSTDNTQRADTLRMEAEQHCFDVWSEGEDIWMRESVHGAKAYAVEARQRFLSKWPGVITRIIKRSITECEIKMDAPEQPPPETGAVDVGRLVNEMGFYILCVGRTRGDMLNHMETQISDFIKPLTARISELESENQNHAEHRLVYEARIAQLEKEKDALCNSLITTDSGPLLCGHKVMVAYDRLMNRAEAAEARVKELGQQVMMDTECIERIRRQGERDAARVEELEAKLAAALKLTTANSIEHVSKQP